LLSWPLVLFSGEKYMIKRYVIVAIAATFIPVFAASSPAFTSDQDKLSYAMGYTTGQALVQHKIALNIPAYSAGLKTGFSAEKPALTPEEMSQALQNFQKQQITKMTQDRITQAEKNEQKGRAFLQKNKTQSGVTTLADGLQYKVLTPGSGASPALTDSVTVNYEGKLLNGTVFDSSYKRNKAITFPVNGVIKGWQEALTLMNPGATWEVYIPANLAYGASGVPGSEIGPNETLVFKINLLSVSQAQK
jgi:FKBP-type peptidyl-prolyl cis-trans isomerase FklB